MFKLALLLTVEMLRAALAEAEERRDEEDL